MGRSNNRPPTLHSRDAVCHWWNAHCRRAGEQQHAAISSDIVYKMLSTTAARPNSRAKRCAKLSATTLQSPTAVGNVSVRKIIINNTVNLFVKLQSAFWYFQTITVFVCCLIKLLLTVYFMWKCINILALEMASPGNRHCANCIGALSFPIQKGHCMRDWPDCSVHSAN